MKIKELFVKQIDRPINGVIKADQRDDESIWQELDEYVTTTMSSAMPPSAVEIAIFAVPAARSTS